MDVFQYVGESIDNAMSAFVSAAASDLIADIRPFAITCVSIYIVALGYQLMFSRLTEPVGDLIAKGTKVIIISTFALTADGYINWVMGAIEGLESGLMASLTSTPMDSSIYATLDALFNKGMESAAYAFERSGNSGWSVGAAIIWFCAGLNIALGTLALTGLGGAMIIVAKAALGLVLAVGPLFIMALMFPATARFFDSWFSQAMNYVLTIVLIAVVMALAVGLYEEAITRLDLEGDQNAMWSSLQLLLLTVLMMYLVKKAADVAGGLAGGVSMAALSLRQLMSPVTSAARAVSPLKQSTRLDPNTGLQTTASRAEHLAMGRSVFARSPAYRQAVMGQLQRAWGKQGGSVTGGR